jgi:hypothetical protein
MGQQGVPTTTRNNRGLSRDKSVNRAELCRNIEDLYGHRHSTAIKSVGLSTAVVSTAVRLEHHPVGKNPQPTRRTGPVQPARQTRRKALIDRRKSRWHKTGWTRQEGVTSHDRD